ncbi:unnamed protein product [Soboliphyme baturini]|uniref:cardiolipin synthase (CMP-forming) n=1 Tax=Soboliphyme baturini TaxID=241478 RepID=A0A183IK44_9BILA|nr:unnamed protein product [Soboliphyme baturini]
MYGRLLRCFTSGSLGGGVVDFFSACFYSSFSSKTHRLERIIHTGVCRSVLQLADSPCNTCATTSTLFLRLRSCSARDRPASSNLEKERVLTIPNVLCAFRLCSAPWLSYLIVNSLYTQTFVLFVAASLTDLADGYVARKFPSQRSILGSVLDPIADKILVASVFLSLTYNCLIPVPLALLVVGRDVLLVIWGAYVRYISLPAPRRLRKFFDPTLPTVQIEASLISKVKF